MTQPCLMTVQNDTPILAELRSLLERDFQLSKTENIESDASSSEPAPPHAVVVDASVPESGDPKMAGPLVVIMMRAKPESVCQVFKTASTGYVFRRCGGTQAAQNLYEMVAGTSNTPTVSDIPAAAPTGSCPLLTTRQTEVLRLVADGHPDKEIASMLCISEKTVEFHKANIRKQLSLRSTAELTRFAIRNGLSAS